MATERNLRELVIHAGTHKTASSYIQSRMAANIQTLAAAGIGVEYPAHPTLKHKPLAEALAQRRWPRWRRFLRSLPADPRRLLLSAEQFTHSLARRNRLHPLIDLLEAEGFRLHVLCFLRDQADYINARYVHSTRRLYHCVPFETYVHTQLAHRRSIYDYNHLFRHLLREPRIRTTFLPYGSHFGDPFERLLAALEVLPPAAGWHPAAADKANVQPGCRGVWLAQAVGARLEALGVPGCRLGNTGSVVRRIAERQGWQDDRYCGFDAQAAAAVANHYAAANDAFALRVWGCRWRDKVPELPMQRRTFEPPASGLERERLQALVDAALVELASGNRQLAKALQKTARTMTLHAKV